MIPLLIAGGAVLGTLVQPELPDMSNHTLAGIEVQSKNVVCRNRWGTPMMPTADGGYSLLAAPDEALIKESLIQPPNSPKGYKFPIYRPEVKAVPQVAAPVPPLPTEE